LWSPGFESVQILFFVGNTEQYAFIQTIHICSQKWKTILDQKVPIFQHKSTTAYQEIFSANDRHAYKLEISTEALLWNNEVKK